MARGAKAMPPLIGTALCSRPAAAGEVTSAQVFTAPADPRTAEFLARHDVLMTPVLAQPPIEAKAWGQGSWAASMAANIRYAPFAAPWNVAGFPAMAVPAGVHPRTGTPLSVQLVAAPGREHLLLSLAAVIERLHPWPRVAPAYAG